MPTAKKNPIAENEAPTEAQAVTSAAEAQEPAQDAPLTKEEFTAQMQRLTERARAAGLNPIQTMLQTYADQGRAMLAGMLGALDSDGGAKKKA